MPVSEGTVLPDLYRLSPIVRAVCVTILVTAAVPVTQAQSPQSAVLAGGQSGAHLVHIVPKGTGAVQRDARNTSASAPACHNSLGQLGACSFNYYSGPVISNVDIVVVYWGSNVSSTVNCGGGHDSSGNCIGVSQFLGSAANSTFLDMLQEYNTAGVQATAGTHKGTVGTQTIGRGSLHAGSPFVITPHPANAGSTIMDANIQNEIDLQIQGGTLPPPATDSSGDVNTLYVVYFPPGLVISDPSIGTSCVQFCAYHNTFVLNTQDVPYGVVPDFGTGTGCHTGCGGGTQFQNITSASSHELAESITDTAVGLAASLDFPLAWYDTNNGEIGDPCNQKTDTITYDSITYTFQQEFSIKAYNANHSLGCVSPGALTFTLTAPASASAGTPFDVTVKVTNGDGSQYHGTAHFSSSDSGVTLPSDYILTSEDAGTHTFPSGVTLATSGRQTITVEDANQPSTAGAAAVTVTGGKTATTTVLSSSPSPSAFYQQVTFSAVVTATSGAPTGIVTFKDGSSLLGTGSVSGGVASLSTSSLTVGPHSITADYGGDTNFSPSSSSVLSQTVNRANTSTALASSLNPSIATQSVMFTATVTGEFDGTPSGTVTFKGGTVVPATAPLVSGNATFMTTFVSSGNRLVTAVYNGDVDYNASTSGALTQTVSRAPTATTVSSSNNPSNFAASVTFTATVTSAFGTPADGDMVKFLDGSTVLGTAALLAGSASFTTSNLSAGAHKVKATYAGDKTFGSSSSTILSQAVRGVPTTTGVSSSLNPSIYGQTVTFSAIVSDPTNSGVPTGTVTFKNGTTILGKGVALSGGAASFSTSTLAGGTRSITATYSGDGKYAASTSAVLSQVVNKAASTTTITSNFNPSTVGGLVTFTISVAPQFSGIPTGTVSLKQGSTTLVTLALVNGTATYATSALASGAHAIMAAYGGSANFTGSSGSVTQTVSP